MWILIAMIVLMPFDENPYLYISNSFLGVFPNFTVIKLLGLIGLGWSLGAALGGKHRLGLLDSKQAKAFALFLATVVFAALASGAGILVTTRLIAVICLLPLVLTAVRGEADLWRTLKACSLVMIFVFPYALRQKFRFGGRLGVGLHETNYLALMLVLCLPIAFVFARQEGVAWKRRLWTAGTGVLLLELVLTGSRGGFLAVLVVMGLLCFRLMKHPAVALAGMGALLLVLLFVIPNPMANRLVASGLSDEVRDSGVEVSNKERIETFRAGIRMIQQHPLTGVGLGMFKEKVPSYANTPPHVAHNTYLEIAAELGLPTLLTFLLLTGATYRSLRRSQRLAAAANNARLHDLSVGLQVGLAGYLVGAAFLSAQYEKFFWLLVFLSICLERIAQGQAKPGRQDKPGQRAWATT